MREASRGLSESICEADWIPLSDCKNKEVFSFSAGGSASVGVVFKGKGQKYANMMLISFAVFHFFPSVFSGPGVRSPHLHVGTKRLVLVKSLLHS